MKSYLKRYARNFDYPLFFTYLLLCCFGLVMVYSASMVWAVNQLGGSPDFFYKKQITNLCIGAVAFVVGAFIPYKIYKENNVIVSMLGVMFALLLAVYFFGFSPGDSGAKSWLNLGFASLQPSEFVKIIIILYFSAVFAKKYEKGKLDNINESIIPPIVVLFAASFLIFLEPDLGTLVIIFFIAVSVIAASGIKFKTFGKILGVLGACMVIALIGIFFIRDRFFTEKRMGRINAYFNPFEDEQFFGYQVVNGYLAIGAGGIKGLGLGQSVQKMGYLPEPQTDFILAIIAEELGTFGVAIVLFGLGYIVIRALVISLRTKDPMARMIAAGIASMIGFQTFINVGGLTGIIPLTGVPLPFISYGGTSLILLSLAMGILINVSMFVKRESKGGNGNGN
ncbi:FtsW/RodA/SpoVE family cell cycle protein [Viridibacillus sp. YIM B01967]|uniref:Probable peptidoglycan glycosyltransferase FtsW n=1 Tax=Viridibacillus soli TaxID=2798301 RepID=A0ABS1H7N6_9BACL|nr:FtsW/RodA/SpoVE family cell cycle protein [Viridibacillus soli]MBK3495421.1 FtsW/RodA/SpoVE family cell cycle protein [Viridibacillus soli]